jgi:hypothetical protein
MDNKKTLHAFKKDFKHENACLRHILDIRVPDKKCLTLNCPGRTDVDYIRCGKKRAFYCRQCFKRYHPCVDTFLEFIKIDLDEAFQIIYQMLSNRNGISSNEIYRNYAPSYPTAHSFPIKIGNAMGVCLTDKFEKCNSEVDESWVNTSTKGLGKAFKMNKDVEKEQNKRGKGSYTQTPVLCIVTRNGACKLFQLQAVDSKNIINLILDNVSTTCNIYTDENAIYNELTEHGYNHQTVKHGTPKNRQWTNGPASTNSCENIFSQLKKLLEGTHRYISEDNLQSICNLVAFKHTYRSETDYGFSKLFDRMPPLSLSYASFKNVA